MKTSPTENNRWLEPIIVFLGQGTGAILTLYLIFLLASRLSDSEFGLLSLAFTFANFAQQIFFSPLSGAFNRFVSIYKAKKRRPEFYSILISLSCFCSLLGGLLGITFHHSLIWLGGGWVIIYAVASSLTNVTEGTFSGARMRFTTLILSILNPLLRIAIIFMLTRFATVSLNGVLVWFTIGFFVLLCGELGFWKFVVRKDSVASTPDYDLRASLFRYALPFASWGIFSFLQQSGDRWALFFWTTSEEVASYSLFFQVGYASFALIATALNQYALPIFFQAIENPNQGLRFAFQQNIRLVRIILLTTMIGLIVLSLSHRQLIGIFSPRYQGFSWYLPWLWFAGGVYAMSQAWANVAVLLRKNECLIRSRIILSLISVLLFFIGAAAYGGFGVIVAQIVFSLLSLVWTRRIAYELVRSSA